MPTAPPEPSRQLGPDAFRRVVRLARIELSEEEERELVPQLGEIAEWIDDLRRWKGEEGDVRGRGARRAPARSARRPSLEMAPAGLDRHEALERAPESHDGFFVVPGPRPKRDPAGDEDE